MSLRVLYLLNISNPDRLAADSGWIFANLLAPALANAGVDVTVAAPAPVDDTRCDFERTPVANTKYRARFATDVDQLASLIRHKRPGVVVANQIEAAPAVRTALMEARSDALLTGYCHYLPFTVVGERLRVVPAPRDQRLVRDPAESLLSCGGELLGVYNHRLYAHYGTARFVRLARRLTAEVPVRLRVMDLFGTRSPDRVRLDGSPEQLRDELAAVPGVEIASDFGERARYRALLAGAHFGIAPFRTCCPWSMSVVDCQGMGLPVIAPRLGWPAEHIDGELLFDTDEQAVALVERLATDREFHAVHAKRAHASTAHLAPSAVAARYLEAIS